MTGNLKPPSSPQRTQLATPTPGGEGRGAAVAAGIALIPMAVVAPAAVYGLVPADRTGLAAVLLLGVVVLAVVVALALIPVLSAGGRALAWVAAVLRLAYSAAFAVAIAELVTPPDPDPFTQSWDASLLVFGVHLLVVGLLLWRMPSRSRVTSALVTLAGLAYATDSVLTTVRPAWADASGAVASACAVVGELALIVWLLVRAGRS